MVKILTNRIRWTYLIIEICETISYSYNLVILYILLHKTSIYVLLHNTIAIFDLCGDNGPILYILVEVFSMHVNCK